MSEYIEREVINSVLKEVVNEFSDRPEHYANDVIDMISGYINNPDLTPCVYDKRGWISVKDRLPDAEQEVLILTENGVITTAMYEDGTVSTEDSCWNWYDVDFDYDEENDKYLISEGWWEYRYYNPDDIYNNCVDDKVTHWMPLPEPPKGVKK